MPHLSRRTLSPVVFITAFGCSEYQIIPMYPTLEDMVCVPTETSSFTPLAHSDRYAGRSLDVITYGNSTSDPNASRVVAVGAPGDETVAEQGRVALVNASVTTGLLGSTLQTVTPPIFSSYKNQFGRAVHGADIRNCFLGSSATYYDACGEEILIGAPDTATSQTPGALHWYYAQASGNTAFVHGGVIVPSGLPANPEFGYAIASPRVLPNPDVPWDVGPSVPAWVAVGAPGADRVLLYTVNASTGAFTLVQTLVSPQLGRRFGVALAAGFFDQDNLPDLAVGAPEPSGSASEGRVYIYRGTTGATPLRTSPLVLNGFALTGTTSGGVQDDDFGRSVAAGRFIGSVDRDALVIGAPLNDWDDSTSGPNRLQQGAVCTAALQSSTSTSGLAPVGGVGGCFTNPWTTSSDTTDQEFGYAVAVGNYVDADASGVMDNEEALLQEVAISRPGLDSSAGEVDIFMTDDSGMDDGSLGAILEQYPGTVAGARFGDAMNDGFIQESGWEDLVIGSPFDMTGSDYDGGATLTQAVDTSACSDIHGTWTAEDFNGDPRDIKIWTDQNNELHLTFLENFAVELQDNFGSGSPCVASWGGTDFDMDFNLQAGTDLNLGAPWTCSATSDTWVDVDGTAFLQAVLGSLGVTLSSGTLSLAGTQLMTVTINFDDTVTPAHIDLDFDLDGLSWGLANTLTGLDEECRPAGLPWGMDQSVIGVCE